MLATSGMYVRKTIALYHSWQVIFWRSLVSNEATARTVRAGQMSSEPGRRVQ